jgi:hypothetical protein
MNGSSPRLRRFAASALAVALLATASRADEQEQELPSWIPSVGLGFGIQSREIDGSIVAFLQSETTAAATIECQSAPPTFPNLPPIPGVCDLSSSENRTSDGAAFDISGQVLGPRISSIPGLSWIPWKPRPYVQGGYAFEYDSRTIAEAGDNPGSFDVNQQNPDLHTRLRANPDYLWYVGGGIALQMPIEFTPVFLKLGAHYLEEHMDAVGSIDQGVNDMTLQVETTESLSIGGAGPSVGIEAEVWRFGPVGLQAAADLFVTFPLSGSDAQFDLDQPNTGENPSCTVNPNVTCIEPAHFDFDADNVHYLGVASLRFAWLGY